MAGSNNLLEISVEINAQQNFYFPKKINSKRSFNANSNNNNMQMNLDSFTELSSDISLNRYSKICQLYQQGVWLPLTNKQGLNILNSILSIYTGKPAFSEFTLLN